MDVVKLQLVEAMASIPSKANDAYSPGLASYCQLVEKTVFSEVKTGLAK